LRPHTSDKAPISGALRKDNNPWRERGKKYLKNVIDMHLSLDCDQIISEQVMQIHLP
jgi:hypothetical protein